MFLVKMTAYCNDNRSNDHTLIFDNKGYTLTIKKLIIAHHKTVSNELFFDEFLLPGGGVPETYRPLIEIN